MKEAVMLLLNLNWSKHINTIFTEHEKVWEDQSNVELVEENNKIIF